MKKSTPAARNPKDDNKFNPKGEWPGSLTLLGKAFDVVRGNLDFVYIYIGILGALELLNYIVNPQPFFKINLSAGPNTNNNSLMITAIATFVSFALTGPLTLYQLRVADGKKVSVSEILKTGLSRIIPFFALNIILVVAVIVGLILLIIPGIYIAMRLVLANYIFFDKNLGPIEALKESFEMTKGYMAEIAGYVGTIILLSLIAGVFSLFLPVFGNMLANAVAIVYGVVGVWLYRWIAKQR